MKRLVIACALAVAAITAPAAWQAAEAQSVPQGASSMPEQIAWNAWGWDRTDDPNHGDFEILMVNFPPFSVPPADPAQVAAPLPWTVAGDDPSNPQWSVVFSFPSRAAAAANPNFAAYLQ